jgi:Cupin domain
MVDDAREQPKEVLMSTAPTAKLVASGQGKTVMLYEDEFSVVPAGTVGARVGDRVLEAGPGASLIKPRGTPHAMWNRGGEPAKVLEILTPGGLETYFEELAPALREHAPPSDYYALAERYGLTIQDDWIEELERTYGVKL